MSCACSPSSSSPPDSGSTGASASRSTVAGGAIVNRQRSCGPSPCPTPPTSSQTGREPYAPTWAETLLGAVTGKLLILLESGIHYLRPLRSGYLRYNVEDESISVDGSLPFISDVPKETDFGFVGKVVPGLKRVCDAEGNAVDAPTYELAAQVVRERDDGALMLGNIPDPGQMIGNEAADLQDQLRFDRLLPTAYSGDAEGLGFLVRAPVEQQRGRDTRIISKWALMESLKLRRSHLGLVEKGTAEAGSALSVVAVPLSGGTVDNPLYALKILNQAILHLPTDNLTAGATIQWNGTAWVAVKRGLAFYPLENATRLISRTTAGTEAVTFPNFPTGVTGKIFARLRVVTFVAADGGQLTFSLRISNLQVSDAHTNSVGWSNDSNTTEATVELSTSAVNFVFAKVGSGTVNCLVDLIGYEY